MAHTLNALTINKLITVNQQNHRPNLRPSYDTLLCNLLNNVSKSSETYIRDTFDVDVWRVYVTKLFVNNFYYAAICHAELWMLMWMFVF